MKKMKIVCLSLLVLTGSLSGARGEDFRTDINPALMYYRAFLVATEPLSDADRNYLDTKGGKENKLPERFGKIVSGFDNEFLLVRQAAHSKVPCDWGIDISAGLNTLLPYLGRAKVASLVARLRAVWALQHGRQEDARDDLLAGFVLGRNAGSDGTVIGAWVQCAVENFELGTVAQNFGEFSAETLRQLVEGFDAAPARHTMAACIPNEKSGIYDWSLRQLLELQKAHPGDDAKVMAGFRDCGYGALVDFAGDTNFWPRLAAASGGTSEGLIKLFRETEPLYPRLAALMEMPESEYEPQFKQLLAESHSSPNPFFSGVLLAWEKIQFRAKEFRAQAELAMVHAAVEYKLHGESGFESVMDPFGKGPFGFERFVFKRVDRGFKLTSAYTGADSPFAMIFVEKQGAAFQVTGPDAGKAITQ
jgi:hypothetical protein